MTRRTPDEYRATIRTGADQLVAAAQRAPLDTTIPSCPDWDVAELLGHMGRVYRWAAACVETNTRVSPRDLPGPPAREERVQWVQDGATRILEVLDQPPDTPAWTWSPDGTVGFWQRRQAHETLIHRVDAEQASGPATPVPAALAVDGIDEWLSLVPNRLASPPVVGTGETVHFHCVDADADGDGEWLIRLTPDGLEVEATHAKADVAARGPASDLLLVLLRRQPPETVEVLGETAVLGRFLDQARF
ncbi:MAG TPA: maleylpyruvate isomerase family mycothiol-dependent enzyme [Acidimicrobiia bacterium]|nr:maleylpyruvate isomerase family mycothiol-dependent enzyme [Acidimicrobiia bacterium]